jgi:hypothetical protein
MTTPTMQTWFTVDDFAQAVATPAQKLFFIIAKDRDGDVVNRIGNIDFEDERFISAAAARVAFEAAAADNERRHYPPVTVEICKKIASGAVPKPSPTNFVWS